MVKWRLFVERWENGYLGFRVADYNTTAELYDAVSQRLSEQPMPVRMTISFVGNHAIEASHVSND